MRRIFLIASSAALLLTSCSEEKFLNDSGLLEANKTNNGAIEFQAARPNQSRSTTALEKYATSFGVFGIKTTEINPSTSKPSLPTLPDPTDDDMLGYHNEQLIFNNYLVGHIDTYPIQNGGATETGADPTSPFTSSWYYEGLGNTEYTPATGSAWDEQYLKYWDNSYKFTYFVAYTPYQNASETTPILRAGKDDHHLLQLECKQPVSINAGQPFMFAAKQELISGHVDGTQETVPLTFYRCQSQIRIAFYEVIKGYRVKMINVVQDNSNPANEKGVTALPYDATKTDKKGAIVTAKTPILDIKNPTNTAESQKLVCDIDYSTSTSEYSVLNFSIDDVYLNSPNGTPTDYLHEVRAEKAFSPTVYNVFPVLAGDPNNDLQFVLSFLLVAEDTTEEIIVRNARVTVPKDYTKWENNCLYTYIFKITKDTNGTTSPNPSDDPETPITPGTAPAIYPIVFDNLTVVDLTAANNASEYTLYDADHNPTATEAFIFKSDDSANKDFVTVNVDATLNLATDTYMEADYLTKLKANNTKFAFTSDTPSIATVGLNTGVVTGVAPGETTIHVTYTEGSNVYKDALIVKVTVAAPTPAP